MTAFGARGATRRFVAATTRLSVPKIWLKSNPSAGGEIRVKANGCHSLTICAPTRCDGVSPGRYFLSRGVVC